MTKTTKQQLQIEIDSTHWCISFCKHLAILTHPDKTEPTKNKSFQLIPSDMFCSKGQNINNPKQKTTPCKHAEIIETTE